MNREIKTKKVGRQKKLTNPCPVSKEYNAERIKILECALEDLDRIHNKRVNLLFEFDKPIIG